MQDKRQKIVSYKGLLVAPFNPFDLKGDLNQNVMPKYVKHIHDSGVKGVFANGTTGEALSLTAEERKRSAEHWIQSKLFDVVIVHVGSLCIEEAKELARHAEEKGATGIAALPPFYYKSPTLDDLVNYYKELSFAAPNTPLMIYHYPTITGVDIPLSVFLKKAASEIPQFCGAKFTSIDIRELSLCQQLENLKIFTGFDEVLLPGLTLGVTGAVGATYNFMGRKGLHILESYHKGDAAKARKHQDDVLNYAKVIGKYSHPISTLKATMNLIVKEFSVGPTRSPLPNLTVAQLASLKVDLEQLGVAKWNSA